VSLNLRRLSHSHPDLHSHQDLRHLHSHQDLHQYLHLCQLEPKVAPAKEPKGKVRKQDVQSNVRKEVPKVITETWMIAQKVALEKEKVVCCL
jgi:hypothetical protein